MTDEKIKVEIEERLKTGDLIFSICSLALSFFLALLIFLNKNLRSLTYDFLKFVFVSEIIQSIGNIVEYSETKLASTFLIPASDMFTMSLFSFFIYCSCEQLIKSNKEIKSKKCLYIFICVGISLLYGGIFVTIFATKEEDAQNFYFYGDKNDLNYLRFIHIGLLFLMSGFICYKTYILIKFLKEKQNSDSTNSWKIAILVKTLFRFPIICILYWVIYFFYILFSFKENDFKIKYLLKLFAKAFIGLRGFLFALNTIQTNKIQVLIEKIIEVHIMHNFILKLNFLNKGGKKHHKKSITSK